MNLFKTLFNMIHRHKKIKEEYDLLAEEEDKQEKSKSLRVEIPREFIEKYIKKTDVVLDAGGGTGVNAILMAEKCKHVTLLDISPKVLEYAKANIAKTILSEKIEIMQGDITHMPQFSGSQFTFLVCVGDSISYVLNKRFDAMKEMMRVLKKNSILILGCDSKLGFIRDYLSKGNLNEAVISMKGNQTCCGMGPKTYAYSIDEMTQLLKQNGCEIIEIASTPTFTDTLSPEIKNKYKNEQWSKLKKLEMELCVKPELLGVGSHLLFVARKC